MADSQLTIKGQRKRDAETKQESYFARELSYGAFERSFTLPEGVDVTKISARYSNGMLEVTVPKPVAEAPRKVAIEVEGASQKVLS
jgi:HSP20 family protein